MAYDGWGKARAYFVVLFFLLTLALPLAVSSDHVADKAESSTTPSLALPTAASHGKQKPDWNKHHYNWKDFENNGSVSVIMAIDDEQFKSLSKSLQNKLTKGKGHTYSFSFVGISAKLDVETLGLILTENPEIQIQPDFVVNATVATTQTGANVMWARYDDWGYHIEGHNTTIAIIDTGINYNHSDLGGGFGDCHINHAFCHDHSMRPHQPAGVENQRVGPIRRLARKPILHLPAHWPWLAGWKALWDNITGHSPAIPSAG